MSIWGNYRAFDVMGDLVFGKDFGMLAGNESRELPDIIDGAAHRELLVFLYSFPTLNVKNGDVSNYVSPRPAPVHS